MTEQTQRLDLSIGLVHTLETLMDLSNNSNQNRYFTHNRIFKSRVAMSKPREWTEYFDSDEVISDLEFALDKGYIEQVIIENFSITGLPHLITGYRPNLAKVNEFLRLQKELQGGHTIK